MSWTTPGFISDGCLLTAAGLDEMVVALRECQQRLDELSANMGARVDAPREPTKPPRGIRLRE